MIKFLDLKNQYLNLKPEIDAAIAAVIDDASFVNGPPVGQFEAAFAATLGIEHCVGVANGTDAIEIALEALNLPPSSEVVTAANSFIASAESITRAGHRVVFADVDSGTYTLDPVDVERRLTPRTKAILAVHLYGHPADMTALRILAGRHGLRLIEDAAQAHGALFDGLSVGRLGDVGTFSFYPGKNLGAYGDAGAIVTQDQALATRCRMIANHGRVDKYNHEFEGRNSRLDTLQAAILNAKLPCLEQWVRRRNEVARMYLDQLRGVGDLILPVVDIRARHAFHLFVVRTERRDDLAAHLRSSGVEVGIHYPIALPRLRAYAYLGPGTECKIADSFAARVLSLPMGEHLADADVAMVCDAIRQFPW